MGGPEELQEHGDVAASDQVQPPGRRPRRADRGALTADAVAVAALAIGVLACSFSWMFFIRSYIVLAGVAAGLLGLLGIVAATRQDRSPALPAAGAALGALAIIAVFATQAVVRHYLQNGLESWPPGWTPARRRRSHRRNRRCRPTPDRHQRPRPIPPSRRRAPAT